MSISNPACITARKETHIDATSATNKRPREPCESNIDINIDIDRRPVTIPQLDPFAPPRTLTPQCLLFRVQLPLAFLDTAQGGNQFFTAHVHILEVCHNYHDAAGVLVVEDDQSRQLYAIERVQRRRYALCGLAQHVTKEKLLARAAQSIPSDEPRRKRQALQLQANGLPWWKMAAVEVECPAADSSNTAPQLALQHHPEPRLQTAPRPQSAPSTDLQESAAPVVASPNDSNPPKPSTPEQTLEELSKQYLDALYLSRTPLAYFVKGPLARARAALSTQPVDLISFLRGVLLTSASMDKKFRDVLADVVKDIPVANTPGTQTKSRRKRKWKAKRDKHGLFVDEKDYIEQWWLKDDERLKAAASNESHEMDLRQRSELVRSRETFLQVIIILEILALEAASSLASTSPAATEPLGSRVHSAEIAAVEPDKKQRKKKELDANALLETLIERLNIFHTLECSPVKTREGENGSVKAETKDELKNFAAEVVIPFFASRIYEVANAVSRKLGGPSAPRPVEKKLVAASRKPGEPTVRQAPDRKPRKPLGRTSTDTLNRTGKQPPALMRSATDQNALAPLIKREVSETPSLQSITAAKTSKAVPRKRVTGLDQYTATRRQIDLSAMSQASQTKIRKSKDVEDKVLRDALNGIRKPNRALATEETARNADESFARALAQSKPSKSQAHRNAVTKDNATVTATPRHIIATPVPRRRLQHEFGEQLDSSAVVPSSTARHIRDSEHLPSSTFAVPRTGYKSRQKSVVETPSRGFAKFMPSGLAREPGTLIESPTLCRNALAVATPSKLLPMPSLADTPLSKFSAPMTTGLALRDTIPGTSPADSVQCDDLGIGLESSVAGHKTSIYAALGWNDDYDELA